MIRSKTTPGPSRCRPRPNWAACGRPRYPAARCRAASRHHGRRTPRTPHQQMSSSVKPLGDAGARTAHTPGRAAHNVYMLTVVPGCTEVPGAGRGRAPSSIRRAIGSRHLQPEGPECGGGRRHGVAHLVGDDDRLGPDEMLTTTLEPKVGDGGGVGRRTDDLPGGDRRAVGVGLLGTKPAAVRAAAAEA